MVEEAAAAAFDHFSGKSWKALPRQTLVQLFGKSVKTRPLTGFCSAAFLWFHLSPPLQLFFLGHAGGASDSLYALQPFPESSFLTSGGGGAVSDRLSPEGLDLGLWCLSLNLPVPLLGGPSIWAEPTPASSYTAVPRCAGAPTSCPHTVRNGVGGRSGGLGISFHGRSEAPTRA